MSDENEEKMEQIDIVFDDGRQIKIFGKLLAEINNKWSEGLEGPIELTFWREYRLYKTSHGKFVIVYASHRESNYEKEKFKVFSNESEVIEYAKKKDERIIYILLKKANLPIIIEIE